VSIEVGTFHRSPRFAFSQKSKKKNFKKSQTGIGQMAFINLKIFFPFIAFLLLSFVDIWAWKTLEFVFYLSYK
jgi:hypothetical protein